MTFSGKQIEERGEKKKNKKSLIINPTNLKNPVTIDHNQNPQTQQNNGINKNHKSSKTMASTKPKKTINPQTHQQNSSTNPKLATTDHMHQQIYKHFKPTKSSSHLLCGSDNLPPTTPQQTQTNNPNQNLQSSNIPTKNPYPLSPIQIKTDPLQNPQPWGHHKDKERGEISEPTTMMPLDRRSENQRLWTER